MANPNPYQARLQRRRQARDTSPVGTLEEAQKAVWAAVEALEERLLGEGDTNTHDVADLTRITHALTQAVGMFLKTYEAGELEARLQSVETTVANLRARAA